MEKLLKNLHWFIILYALVNMGLAYMDHEERYNSIIAQEESVRAEFAKNKKTKRDITDFYKNIKEAKEKIERVALEIERTQQLLPSEISDTENIGLLRKIADDVNIKEVSISPEQEVDRGFYLARRYRFKAKATYLQFLIIFEKISENKRILNVGQLDFKKLEQPQRSKFQLINGEFVLEAYRYNINYKEDRGINEIESQFKDNKAAPRKPKQNKEEV
jgi:Tfp pilus assembly protein PilO